MTRDVVVVSACRTAIGTFGGTLADTPAPELGAIVIREAIRRAGIEAGIIDEVLMGCVVASGQGQAPARQAAIKAGVPPEIGATTVNKICGSGLKTVMLASAMIQVGDADIIVAGGMENMNQIPFYLPRARTGYRMGGIGKGVRGAVPDGLIDGMVLDGLWCSFCDHHMGSSAEWVAREFELTREELDEYAFHSHRKAVEATREGRFKEEIVPVEIPQRKGDPIIFDTEENPRDYGDYETGMAKLGRLRPAFEKDGIVTAGNSPGITDGAAAVVVMGADKAEELGLQPMARVVTYEQAAVEPIRLFTAPIYAMRNLMERQGVDDIDYYDLIEANEAFAAQCVADGKALGWDWDRVNVNGGAIALGHPIGCSGARVLVTLLYALKHRGLKTGAATLCLGGGEAVALSVEML
ncbi:MAG: acetyl-CoA C-acetyltransferase [Chloroflexia bacterium]|nr:acetyl-CoA C-acetyltransferase [Chloroflexia bacterium]